MDVRGQVLEIVKRVLRRDEVEPRLDFFDLGASSLAVVQIVELVRDECAADIWLTDAFDAEDIGSFADLAAERAATG